jgi:hypothetical protein
MSPKTFWKTTPRGFFALLNVYKELNGNRGDSPREGFIDEVI